MIQHYKKNIFSSAARNINACFNVVMKIELEKKNGYIICFCIVIKFTKQRILHYSVSLCKYLVKNNVVSYKKKIANKASQKRWKFGVSSIQNILIVCAKEGGRCATNTPFQDPLVYDINNLARRIFLYTFNRLQLGTRGMMVIF